MAREARYQLLHSDGYDGPHVRVHFRHLAIVVTAVAATAFVFCVVYSLIYNFESTNTHCRGHNVLPSVSAAIGGYSPQKEVWKTAILFHAPPRFMMVYLYADYNTKVLSVKAGPLIALAAALHFIENVALISLSLFDSSHYYPVHEKSFITFVLASELYMVLLVVLQYFFRQRARTKLETYALKMKITMVCVNVVGIMFAMYFFVVHNTYCPDYAYTKFAICEYVIVFSNMLYHLTAMHDFHGRDLIVYCFGLDLTDR